MFRALVVVSTLFAVSASAIVIRHDRDDARYRELAAKYPAAVHIGGDGEGTLIAPRWVLTAAHVAVTVSPIGSFIECNGKRYPVEAVIVHPAYLEKELASGKDLALLKLAEPVTGVKPAALYEKKDERGKTVIFVGKGDTGNGQTGPTGNDGAVRAARNRVDDVDPNTIVMTFDAPEKAVDLEGISGPGDSGGPAFIESNGKLFIAGVSSYNRGNGHKLCTYGTTEHYARVSTNLDWLRKTMKADPPGNMGWSKATKTPPGSPAGRRALAYLASMDGGPEAMRTYRLEQRTKAFLERRTDEQHRASEKRMADRFAGAEPVAYAEAGPAKVCVVVKTKSGTWNALTFETEATEPHGLDGIYVSDVLPQAE